MSVNASRRRLKYKVNSDGVGEWLAGIRVHVLRAIPTASVVLWGGTLSCVPAMIFLRNFLLHTVGSADPPINQVILG